MLLTIALVLASPSVDWRLKAAAHDPIVAELLGLDPRRLPVWVELERADRSLWRALRKNGLRGGVEAMPLVGPFASGWVAADDLDRLASSPGLVRLETYTPAQIHAPLYRTNEHLRARRSANLYAPDRNLHGQGVRVVNIDVGLDYHHPAFFETGEPIGFLDVDQSGDLSPGDGVDLNDNGVVDDNEHLRVLHSKIHDWRAGLIEGSELDRLEPDLDWLFIDVNGNGRRDFDADARPEGEATDALGEPLFAMLDRDGDGQFSARDRLIPLRRSRVHVYRNADRTYRRGVDLTQAPHDSDLHGTGVWGILAGGPTHHRFAGIAPRATILHFHRNRYNLVDAIHFAVAEKAHLVLHEYGAWVHQYGDGSSIVERLVGHSQTLGIPHVLPAGNLASSRRSARFTLAAGETKTLTLFLPRRQIQVLYGSVIWTGSESVQAFVTPRNGREERLPTAALQAQDFDDPSRRISAEQRTNERGTHKLDWVLWGWQGRLAQLPDRAWTMRLVNPSDEPAELLLRIGDNKTSWTGGAHFRGEGFSTKTSSATWPSTATGDAGHGVSVFAFTGRADRAGGLESEATGDLRSYSGHGPRSDGRALNGLAAPDNPSTTWPSSANQVGHAGYGSFNGTSGAGPHVAGAIALLVQAGLSANQALAQLIEHAAQDEQTEAGPEGAWGAGKVRLDRAIGRTLPALSGDFSAPVPGEPAPSALVEAPADGVQRLRLTSSQPWIDWRTQPFLVAGGDEPVEVEWISHEGRRGRYLVDLTAPAQASEPGALPGPLGRAVQPTTSQPPSTPLTPPTEPLAGAPPPSGCSGVHPSLWLLLALGGARRRR
ncbi:MAG: S8 family serine peptidase [Myxococcota bacterium]|nr:S8 family serine peptidase [Myxococcota bacterium]